MHVDEPPGQAAEAARYAVLRRIGPALRHDLIANLQAVDLMSEVVASRLDRGLPPLADLQHHLSRIRRGTREALSNSLRVATWLVPPEDDCIGLRQGIDECVALVRGNLELRGFSVRVDIRTPELEVSAMLLRPLALAALLRLADQAPAPAELRVGAHMDADHATLVLERASVPPEPLHPLAIEIPYRRLQDDDIQALALDRPHDLQLEPHRIQIRLRRLVATTPLQIAPL